MPKVEDIFASLAGGKRFTKLDLKDAYLQMVMDEESKKLLTITVTRIEVYFGITEWCLKLHRLRLCGSELWIRYCKA